MTKTTWNGEVAAGTMSDDPEVLRAQIERTRTELGETVEALVAKADVRARTREKLAGMTARAGRTASQARGVAPWGAAAVLGALAVGLVAWRRGWRR
jgi:Protein of unknown function (DUF3618)